MFESVAFVGTGAVGGSVAADLIDGGTRVTVIDQWPAHVEAMRTDGLLVAMPGLEVRVDVDAWHLCDLASHWPEFDLVFIAVDAYDSRWVSRLIEPYLAPHGLLVGIQNSMTLSHHIDIVGNARALGAVVELSAHMFEPGIIERNTNRAHTWMAVGETDGSVTRRLEAVADMLRQAATVEITANIAGAKWSKLVTNSMMMGPYALFGLTEGEASRLPGMMDISIRLGREAAEVGRALGHELEPLFGLSAEDLAAGGDEALRVALTTLLADVGDTAINTMIQDQMRGRRSEFAWINGLVARRGRDVGVATPANDAVHELSRQLDAGHLEMSADNLHRLVAMIAED